MPELPEVETIRVGLQKYLVGKTLQSFKLILPKIVVEGDLQTLVGATVLEVRRFGKVLVFDFNNGFSLLSHIKLTGQFVYLGPDRPRDALVSPRLVGSLPNKFTHVIFGFSGEGKLFYNDIRQFGWLRIIPTQEVESFKFIRELGPEPPLRSVSSAEQATLTFECFKDLLAKRQTKIKVLLLDQTKIGGVGNIYANDALFLAGIDPSRRADSLSLEEQSKLYGALLEVLKRGLEYGGASEMTYVNALGGEGEYQKHFLVYGAAGQVCKNNCGGRIVRVTLGGRGTFYCPSCQK